jgi:hypothetical protein
LTHHSLRRFERYYLRIKGKQVPVEFVGFAPTPDNPHRLQFKRLDTGEPLYKRNASALSRHSDQCCWWVTGCDCALLLSQITPNPKKEGLPK